MRNDDPAERERDYRMMLRENVIWTRAIQYRETLPTLGGGSPSLFSVFLLYRNRQKLETATSCFLSPATARGCFKNLIRHVRVKELSCATGEKWRIVARDKLS